MSEPVSFNLDGHDVEARPGETIWQVARRHGKEIPHLCYRNAPGYRADGNCRCCVVEIEGERALAASCIRAPRAGMRVVTNSQRALNARRMVLELLAADAPAQPAPQSDLRRWLEAMHIHSSRFPQDGAKGRDASHPAILVDHDACIQCGLCVRACREVQGNDVIGMAMRGHHARIVFDQNDPMGASTCVACGECVQVCPTGALLPAAHAAEQADRTVDSLCPYCGVGCQVRFHIKDERIIRVEGRNGPANQNRLCVKGRFGSDYTHHPHRLTTPLIRRDDAPKSPDAVIDPANPWTHFRAASWDEALDRAAEGFRRIRAEHGGDALAGLGSAKGSNEEGYLFQKLMRAVLGTNNVDHCARLCHSSSVAALMECIGSGAVTAPFTDCALSDVILVIGANPPVNHPVAATFMKNAADRGAKLVVIDPRANELTPHAALTLNPRPGTDVALLNAMMHVIVTEGLFDRAFIDSRTEGFADFAAHLDGYSPEAMADHCGIAPEAIRAVARLYATAERAIIFWGMGITQHVHGTNNARCIAALALMCGQIGRPGTGLHPLRGQNNVQGLSDVGVLPNWYPGYQPVDLPENREHFEALWGVPLNPRRGLTLVEMIHGALAGRIRGMMFMGENPAMSDPDTANVRRGLAALEHLVVQEIFLTETAMFADVVLPASSLAEKNGSFTNTNRQVQLARQALEPPGEARQDWWILQELAHRLGADWFYAGPPDIWEDLRRCWPAIRGIPWERLERDGWAVQPCADENSPGQSVLMGEAFATPSGKGRFVPVDIVSPAELPDADYPLVLTTGRLLEHWHTGAMTRRAAVLDAIEPDPVAHFAPADLARHGIAPGALVRLATRRGTVEVTARLDPAQPEGAVFMPFCFTEAPANALTNPALDPISKIPEYKYCAVRVERVGGAGSG